MTNDPLAGIKEVLVDLEKDLAKTKTLWEELRKLNPDFEQLSIQHWTERENRCWLYGATDVRESNELERWLYDSPPLSDTAKSNAHSCVKAWKDWLEIRDAYYEPFEAFEFDEPKDNETLIAFILRMATVIQEEGPLARLEWRAWKSFIGYLRNIDLKEIAFIEQIFPEKMDIRDGCIIRKIAPEVPSIPEETAAAILKQLAHTCRFGRSNAQLTAAESLGLSWLCLTASRLRLPIYFEILKDIKLSALQCEGEYPIISIPTFFGDRPIRISERLAKFLHSLAQIPSQRPRDAILQRPHRSLTRTFEETLKKVSPNPEFGNITFISFLSPPHFFGNHRYQPK